MKYFSFLAPFSLLVFCIGCSSGSKLPDGVTLSVGSSQDIILSLDDNRAVLVKSNKPNTEMLLIGNDQGILKVVQLGKGGLTPLIVEFLSPDAAKIVISRNDGDYFIADINGDGIPEIKKDKTGEYELKFIDWKRVNE